MIAWLKQQSTEISAWAGFLMIMGAFLFPRSVFIFMGIVLIAVDDDIVHTWLKRISPKFAQWLDNV